MYKFLILAAAVACANAGYLGAPLATTYAAPAYAAYGHAAVAPAAITSQSSNILRSYGNLGQVSTYSKTIDTPYSSVTKSDVRVSNPGYRTFAPAAYAPAYAAAPVATYHAAPVVAKAYAPAAYAAAPAVAAHGLLGVAYSAAPAVAHVSYDSPLVHYALLILVAAIACANACANCLSGVPLATTYAAAAYAAYGHAAVAPAAIISQSSNILRSYGNLGQVSTYSKTIDTPYSSVTKSDVRVSNPGFKTIAPAAYVPAYAAAPVIAKTYAPAIAAYHAAPVVSKAYAPVAYAAAPAVSAHGFLGVAYSAAPAVTHVSYDSPIVHYAL